jgi:hypothetical protein
VAVLSPTRVGTSPRNTCCRRYKAARSKTRRSRSAPARSVRRCARPRERRCRRRRSLLGGKCRANGPRLCRRPGDAQPYRRALEFGKVQFSALTATGRIRRSTLRRCGRNASARRARPLSQSQPIAIVPHR